MAVIHFISLFFHNTLKFKTLCIEWFGKHNSPVLRLKKFKIIFKMMIIFTNARKNYQQDQFLI